MVIEKEEVAREAAARFSTDPHNSNPLNMQNCQDN